MAGIVLKNIDLTGITLDEQLDKLIEEGEELGEALVSGTDKEIIEEFWDDIQALVGVIEKLTGITADELMKGYPEHLEKLKNRPRIKE